MQGPLEQLMHNFPAAGVVEWIGVRPEKKQEVIAVDSIILDTHSGIQGDHYAGRSGKRQVTLIQAEHLAVIASVLQQDSVQPEQLRRNILVRGINLLAFKDKSFQLGEAVLEYTGLCHPCSRMEKVLGEGGYNAMRGHGGITARVIHTGSVRLGDTCQVKT